MPSPTDNSISDPTPAELTPSETDNSATPKWDKMEKDRLTRRAALRKMGYTSGIALFSMFAVDDLARMAIKKMEQHKETRQVAETVAKEFKNAGIALADPVGSCYPAGGRSGSTIGGDCAKDSNVYCNGCSTFECCITSGCEHYNSNNEGNALPCETNARTVTPAA